MKKLGKGVASVAKDAAGKTVQAAPARECIRTVANGVLLVFHAKPGAKHSKITDISPDSIGVQINAPPVDGKANEELIDYLSGVLGVRKTKLSLEKGSMNRNKTVLVTDITEEQAFQRLSAAADS